MAPNIEQRNGSVEFGISGLRCQGCVKSSREALLEVPGVLLAEVDLASGRARVEVAADFSGHAALDAALRAKGFSTDIADDPDAPDRGDEPSACETGTLPGESAGGESRTLRFEIDGMSCASCVAKVQSALSSASGVRSATVNFGTHAASVEALGEVSPESLVRAVAAAGYGARFVDIGEDDEDPLARDAENRRRAEAESRAWRSRFIEAAAGSAIIMGSQSAMALMPLHAAVATLVQVRSGAGFYRGSWRALRAGSANMDTLIALSTTIAWGNGIHLWLAGGHGSHDFMTASMLLAFVSLGKWLETRGRIRAGDALRALLELAPAVALRLRPDGSTEETPARDLLPGDLCRILQGARIPTDGTLHEGRGEADESMLTGESRVVVKEAGDELFGGTVNAGGAMTMRVTRVGSETALRQIVRRMDEAQNTRPEMQAMADRVSAVFVPAVMVVAAVVFVSCLAAGLGTAVALSRLIAVLIVACPCALGLATPLAVMAGVGVAARRGIIVRSARSLEVSGLLGAVIFDKTGTLTMGEPEVTAVFPSDGHDETETLAAAASLEAESTHPLARAVLAAARARGVPVRPAGEIKSVVGRGIESGVSGVLLGSDEFLRERGVGFEGYPSAALRRQSQGETLIGVGRAGGDYIGAIALADRIRPGATEAVRRFRSMGLRTAMISGDSEEAARAVAAILGMDDCRWRVPPGAKADAVRAMQQGGVRVAMVGDGINDAPALAQADLGIAMAGGSDIAQQAAGIVLLGNDPMQAVHAVRLARAVRRKMRQNLGWAFVYNTALIPLAALGLFQPVYASAAMAFSSVSVVVNALFLTRWRP